MSERVGERIDGVIVAKTSMPVMRVSIRENLGADPRGKTQQQLIMMLTEHFAKDATRLIGCDACNGYSDKDLKGCPYCGAADEVPDASVSFEEGESSSEDSNVVVLPQTKVHKAELVPNASSAPSGAEKKIREWVQQFEKVRCMSALTEWKMGKLLNEARDTNLWRLKVGPTGKLIYTNFFKFVEAELNTPGTTARSYMFLADSFEEAVIERFSRSIITASLNAPPAIRGELFASIQAGLSEEELLGKIQTLRHTPSKEQTEQVSTGVIEERAKLVTLVSKPTKQRVKLFMSTDEDKRAKRIGDRPKGLLELERGTLVFEVGVDEAGNMELIVKALPPER